jgi:hypothetical protein
MTRTPLHLKLFVILFATLFLKPDLVLAVGPTDSTNAILPNFADFDKSVQNGQANILRGVYVPGVLALPIVQQPTSNPFYVSNRNGELTQFALVSQYGNTGLLAHNTLSGKLFSQLFNGQEVRLIYGDGRVAYYVIESVLRFQALQPDSTSSSFRNLDRNETISAGSMFNRVYAGGRRAVFQTCIAANGNSSWGRLFVVAIPKKQ